MRAPSASARLVVSATDRATLEYLASASTIRAVLVQPGGRSARYELWSGKPGSLLAMHRGQQVVDLSTPMDARDRLNMMILSAMYKAITGEEKLRRLKERPEFIRCGGSVFYALWLDYEANKENSILEWLDRNFQVTSLDFMGQILRSPSDLRYVLCLCRDDYYGEWGWHYDWLGYLWGARNFSVGC